MAKAAREMTVSDLERLLDTKKTQLNAALKKRATFLKDLEQVEKRIRELEGKPRTTRKKTRRVRRRARNKVPLPAVVTEILAKSKKGLSLSELREKVLATGYKSNSANFKNVLYQCLYNSKKFIHDEKTKTYRLRK